MLSRSRLIAPTKCLRCQLAEVQCRPRYQQLPHQASKQCRDFSSSRRSRQDASEELSKRKKPYYWKHVHDGERVVGKPGRRQRVVSEGLSTTSLGKPSNVIVFRDFKEEPIKAVPARGDEELSHIGEDMALPKASLSAQDIEHAITARHAAPRDEEVHASIDALRPYETIQSQHAFDRLQQSLSKGYTFQQLSRYLVRSLRNATSAVKPRNLQQLQASQWQPGQTPLQQRRNLIIKKISATRKSALVDQILRLVWHITIHSEAQEIGELEIKVQPWQLSMLFDLADNGKPYYESLIRSKMLLDACELHSWPAGSSLRITGRRQDAEEIARQLRLAMLGASRLDLDLKTFMPLTMHDAHRDDLSKILSDENIRYVSELTKTVLEIRGSSIIHIYGLKDSTRNDARRLLVALLQLPGLCSCTEIFSGTSIGRGGRTGRRLQATIPAANQGSGLHRRYDGFELGRAADQVGAVKGSRADSRDGATTISTKDPTVQESERSNLPPEPISKALSSRLDQLPKPSTVPSGAQHDPGSYWRSQAQVDDWEAEYCTLLSKYSAPDRAVKAQRSNKKNASQRRSTSATNNLIIQRAVPGVETLLSYFETTNVPGALHHSSNISSEQDHDRPHRSRFHPWTPYLSAHFVPITSRASTTALPRLEMRFRLLPSTSDQSGNGGLLLTKISAALDTQTVMVPMPHCAVDLRFTRDATLLADTRAARKDKAIRAFIQRLQNSVNASEGALTAQSEVSFKLPHWLVHRSEGMATAKSDVEVPYLFERFEQTQRTVFTASGNHTPATFLDEEIRASLGALSDSMILDYREVESGSMYGRSTSLSIRTTKSSSWVSGSNGKERFPPSGDAQVDAEPVLDDDAVTHSNIEESAPSDRGGGDIGGGKDAIKAMGHTGSASLKLATAAFRFANLLTRASSGSLLRMGEEKDHAVVS